MLIIEAVYCVDAFADLHRDFFGRSEEYSWLYLVTAYLLIWGCVIIVTWLLLNYVIAAIFRAYLALHEETTCAKAEFAWHAQHLTVRCSQPSFF